MTDMPVRRGVHAELEAAADQMLWDSLKGVTSHQAKSDILTPWKLQERQRRELMVPSGTPDPAVRKGVYHRSINTTRPELNSRDGVVRGRRGGMAAYASSHPEDTSRLLDSGGWDSP